MITLHDVGYMNMNTEAVREAVEARLAAGCKARVFALDTPFGRVWVKQTEPVRITGWHRLMRVLYLVVRQPLLAPTVTAADGPALDAENRRLIKLAAAAVPVPRVLVRGPGWLALEDVGEAIQDVLHSPDMPPTQAMDILGQSARALAALHGKGRWHGKPTLKDITWNKENGIYFVDFEEDVSTVLKTKLERYVRDFLIYHYSLHRVLTDVSGSAGGSAPSPSAAGDCGQSRFIETAMDAYFSAAPDGVLAASVRIGFWVNWVVWPLYPIRGMLGKDARAILAAARSLYNLRRREGV